ncbi:matrixin family metalloprotease [uncultured Aquimarina sp.]|uniref:matrixin family metalloprotease n=1 Tax=uncultured Aquimarina sp. TaxID=575652 RepID=UPI002619B993|nr:matrixin family metalloprotease [uncultured Aquimarina sp.]
MGTNKKNKVSKNIFSERKDNNPFAPAESNIHLYGKSSIKCETDSRGYATPKDRDPAEIVVDASEGFIPLWKKDVNLRWRFNPSLYNFFQYPDQAMDGIRTLLSKGIREWGDAAPIRFSERNDAWDFEIIVKKDNCDHRGCTLASAFFPDGGRHQLVIYPQMFLQSEQEQIETMAHELGHIFGLRHFFAEISEAAYPSIKFGAHKPFTIMNYGPESKMTANDRKDLKALYEKVWSGELTEINRTRIVTFWPYHYLGGFR